MTGELSIFTDGGARGNPGPAAIGVVIYHGTEVVAKLGAYIGKTTNNVAEYRGVLAAYDYLLSHDMHPSRIAFYLDSLLVAEQLKGVYKTKKEDLKELLHQVKVGERKIKAHITYTHIRREKNQVADALVNKALDSQLSSF